MIEIYGTLGPACAREDVLAEMLRSGMTGVRLNLSHGSLRHAAPLLEQLRAAQVRCGVKAKLLMDMQGPEVRIGALADDITLEVGAAVSLDALALPPQARAVLSAGKELLLDDGKLLLRVLDGDTAQVVRGGVLRSRKSAAVVGTEIRLPPLTEQDVQNIAVAKEYGVTGLMQPFVRSADDLKAVRKALNDAGCGHIRLFAKIEDTAGAAMLPELIPEADEIVIARGDLGNAMPLWELPVTQKKIAAACRDAGKPFMVVTQMLASMEHSPVPTRAEVSDVCNAVLDGAASVMVTGETAVGGFPVETIRYLARTAAFAEAYRNN